MVFAATSDDQLLFSSEVSEVAQKSPAMEIEKPTTQPMVREASLGNLPKGYQIIPSSIKMSPDVRNVAYAAYSDNTHNIIQINDRTSPIYYAVQPGMPIFSPQMNRHAYIAYLNIEKSVIVVDGKTIDTVNVADNFIFSPDGSRYACRVEKNKKQYVIVDGKPGAPYKGIPIKNNFLFSPDSKRFIYVALKGDSCVAVVDGKEEPLMFNFIQNVRFSPDSAQYTYKARTEKKANGKEKWCVVKNGRAGNIYNQIFDLVFSFDSKHLAYSAVKDRKVVLVFDDSEKDSYDMVGIPVFSFDSKTFTYAYTKNNKWHIVVNDERSAPFDELYRFYFSPDSKRNAFIAKNGDDWFCIVDDKKGDGFEKMVESFKFSLNSKRFLYAGVDQDGSRIIIDEQSGPIYRSVGEPYFSPDSRHVVYRAIRPDEDRWITVLDETESKKNYIGIGKYEFSDDSKHLAFPAFVSISQTVMVVDGTEQCADRKFKILGDPTFSPDGNYIIYHARAAEEKWHLIINGNVLPETYGGFFRGTPIIFDSPAHCHTMGIKPGGTEFIVIDVDIPETFKLTSEIKLL